MIPEKEPFLKIIKKRGFLETVEKYLIAKLSSAETPIQFENEIFSLINKLSYFGKYQRLFMKIGIALCVNVMNV